MIHEFKGSMNRIDRLLGMLVMLQSRKFVSADAIADKFGISIRTVYRDLRALTEQGIPIGFEKGKGYFVVEGYFLAPVSFTTEEANALLLMERMVRGLADRSIQKHYTNALNKVKAVLRYQQKDQVEELDKRIKYQFPSFRNNNYEYLGAIQESILHQHILEINYQNNRRENKRRQIEAIGLIYYAFNWHLIAWCHLRKDYRDFRVSRIIGLHKTTLPFQKADHMELKDYMEQLPVKY